MALPSAFKYMYLAKTRATKFCSLSDRVGGRGDRSEGDVERRKLLAPRILSDWRKRSVGGERVRRDLRG